MYDSLYKYCIVIRNIFCSPFVGFAKSLDFFRAKLDSPLPTLEDVMTGFLSRLASRTASRRNTADEIVPPVIVKQPEPRSHYLDLLASEVASRVLLVSDPECAKLLRMSLDEYGHNSFMHTSGQGVTTITGKVKQKPVSIIAIGNGMSVMDAAVHELRDITKGPLTIIHLAICSTHKADVAVGTAVVAVDSFARQTLLGSEPAAFTESIPLSADLELVSLLANKLERPDSKCAMIRAGDVTTDTFYAGQGRNKEQLNQGLFSELNKNYPNAVSLQMQTYPLYRLAYDSQADAAIKAAACAIVVNNLATDRFLENQRKYEIELYAGQACLQTLSEFKDG